jgi:hypothetical protein
MAEELRLRLTLFEQSLREEPNKKRLPSLTYLASQMDIIM